MTPREHHPGRTLIAAVWGAVVTAALIAVPLTLRERLPKPLAVHWGPGLTANRAASFGVAVAMPVALWAVLWLTLLVAAARGLVPQVRPRLLVGGAHRWRPVRARPVRPDAAGQPRRGDLDRSGPAALASLRPGGRAAGRGGARRLPRQGRPRRAAGRPGAAGAQAQARPARQSVSRVSNPWPLAITVVAAVGLFALGAFEITGIATAPVVTGVLPVLGVVLVVSLFASSLTARVTEDGLVLGFGPLGWPKRRIRLAKIDKAWTEERSPSQVGGWGVRGTPGAVTIMLRGGECLVIGYRSGGQLAVSIDDAERAASLINALVSERTPV